MSYSKLSSLVLSAILFLGCALSAGATNVVASSKKSTVSVSTGNFNKIKVDCIAKVIYSNASSSSVKITAPDNIQPFISAKAVNGTLDVKLVSKDDLSLAFGNDAMLNDGNPFIVIEVSSPELRAVDLSNSSVMVINGNFTTPDFAVNINGLSSFSAKTINCNGALKATLSGNGALQLGNVVANSLKCALTGDGNIKLKSFSGTSANVFLLGQGQITAGNITADSLTCSLNGQGSIRLDGDVPTGNLKLNGRGSISAAHLNLDNAFVNASGSGEVYCKAQYSLSTATTDGCKVFYYGNPSVSSTGAEQPQHLGI